MFQIVPIVAGNAVLAVEGVIDLDALLVDRIHLRSRSLQEIVVHIGRRPGHRAVIRRQRATGLKHGEGLHGSRTEQALGNYVAGKDLTCVTSIRVLYLAERIVNGNQSSAGSDPLAEIAV